MRRVLRYDSHGNGTGLKTVLAHLETLGGWDGLYVRGDMLGGGPGTEDVLDILMERQAHMLRGNWEELLLEVEAHADKTLNPPLARASAAWLQERLSTPYVEMIRALPLDVVVAVE